MRSGKASLFVCGLVLAAALHAQDRQYPGLGSEPTTEEIRAWDIAINPDGDELPPGRGTAKEGAALYAQKCAACHGQDLEGGVGPELAGGQGTLGTLKPIKSIGNYWPFATTIWDYINRAMPPNNYNVPIPPDQQLTPDNVYALTAYLLYRNGIIGESDVLDANSLPEINMPNRNGFVPVNLQDVLDYRGRGCRAGTCP